MVTIQHALSFTDGSGVEALIDVGGVKFAASFSGALRHVRCLGTAGLNRGHHAKAVRLAEHTFAGLCERYMTRWG